MNRVEVRKISEGALILSMYAVVFMFNRQTAGLFNVYIAIALPLPLIIYVARYNFKAGLVPYVAMIILAFVLGEMIMFILAIMYGTIGLFYGYGIKKKWQNRQLIGVVTFSSVIVYFMTLVVFASLFGFSLEQEVNVMIDLLTNMDLAVDTNLMSYLTTIVIVAYIMAAIVEGFLIHMLAQLVLKRFKIQIQASKPIEQLKFPKWTGWVMLVLLFAYPFTQAAESLKGFEMAAFALFIWVAILLTYHAFVFVIIVQRKTKLRSLVAMSIIILILFPSVSIYLFILLGLLDIVTDVRLRILGVKVNV